jgi:cyanophycin synthetase
MDMKVIEIKVLRGPNYWSTYRKQLIQVKLDLGEYEQKPTNKLNGFAGRLQSLLPSLYEHECSEKKPGGFLERVKEGTWLGHVIEHVALELQTLAGMDCGYGRTRSVGQKGVYHVVFAYEVEKAGLYAATAAINLVKALADGQPYDCNKDIKELTELNRRYGLGPSAKAILNAARNKNIPYRRLDNNSLILLGYGKFQKMIRSTISTTTSALGVEFADDKDETKRLLQKESIPVPHGVTFSQLDSLDDIIEEVGWPMVIKPLDGNHGRGVTTNIRSREEAEIAFHHAKQVSKYLIAEKYLEGFDYRFLLINYKLVAVAKRVPAMVMGDGISTIDELIRKTNEDPARGEGHEKTLTTIKIDEPTKIILAKQNLSLDAVLPEGQALYLKNTANISTGGTAIDVTSMVNPHTVFVAERIARLLNLDICGIDVIAKDIEAPLVIENGAVLEVNASPGLRMHLSPSEGSSQPVGEAIIEMLFPGNSPARIPIVAITGTNGKTTTTRLVSHLMKEAGYTVGFTSTDGIYINENMIEKGDCSGPASAQKVLRDPLVDFAVLECARGGIIRSGLGFDQCSTSIITSITDDHLGLDDINSVEDLAKVKSVVAQSTMDDGYAILNADDELVYGLAEQLDCRIALFSVREDNKYVKSHCQKGGTAAVLEDGYVTIYKNGSGTRLMKAAEIPLSFEGKAILMIKNILAAVLAAVVNDLDIETIKKGLKSFIPSPERTPGRMNVFQFRHFKIMLDYAHNRDGLSQLKEYIDNVQASVKTGIITSPGDRREEDIINVGKCAAEIFDEIIIRHDDDTRGRTKDQITELIKKGINSVNAHIPVNVISGEIDSIQYAMDMARENSFIVACIDKVQTCLEYVIRAKEFDNTMQYLDSAPSMLEQFSAG